MTEVSQKKEQVLDNLETYVKKKKNQSSSSL